MRALNATELAAAFDVTKGRVSQWVSEGKLDGCFVGDGRARRFDVQKAAEALGRKLDPAQSLGNGASTRDAIQARLNEADATVDERDPARPRSGATELTSDDGDRYALARAQKAEEEARRLRRQNAQEEGTFVLASEVALETRRALSREVALFESVLRAAARTIADDMGVDFKAVRHHLNAAWREHRVKRADILDAEAASSTLSDAEREADI